MEQLLMVGGAKPVIIPGAIQGIWEAQPILTAANDTDWNSAAWDAYNGALYVGGGYTKPLGGSLAATTNNVKYDLVANTVTTLKAYSRYAIQPDISYYNGKLYLSAGVPISPSTTSYLNTIDLAANINTQDSAFSLLYKNVRVCILDNVIHVLGGTVSSGGVTAGCYTYDLATKTLTSRGNGAVPTYIQAPGHGVIYNGKFYFSAGRTGTANVMACYDPTTYTSVTLANNPNSLIGESLVLIGDNIYTRSGNNQIGVYSIPGNSWSYIDAPNGPTQTGNTSTVWFFYNDTIWYKFLDSTDTTVRRFWRLY